MNSSAAVILAGGKGERLGGANKALLQIGGKRLVDRVRDRLTGCWPVLLSVGREPFLIEGLESVADLETGYAGPLAGLAAAVEHLAPDAPEFLLSVAVDTPFLPHDFVPRLRQTIAATPSILASYRGQLYPTNALWRFVSIRDLPSAMRNGTSPRSLKRLGELLGTAVLDFAEFSENDPFANVNTRADLAALDARAATENKG